MAEEDLPSIQDVLAAQAETELKQQALVLTYQS